ncbi:protein of unknown function [Streptococcus thermophilus]|nr:protein of unknown function [Streptococcus thermophilus]
MSDMSIISAILVVAVAFLAGLESILDQFHSTNHLLHVPSSVLPQVTSLQVSCLVVLFK